MCDDFFMNEAITEARLSKNVDGEDRPFVGAVLVVNGKIVGKAHRGELGKGEHAEFTLFQKKLKGISTNGATLYTTLEPCTHRAKTKTSCTDWVRQSGVSRVIIGILDPNPMIAGRGFSILRAEGMDVSVISNVELQTQYKKLNTQFIAAQRNPVIQDEQKKGCAPIDTSKMRSHNLDRWYEIINGIYWSPNSTRGEAQIFMHLVEILGALSLIITKKNKKPGVRPDDFILKSIAWWLALCGKVGIKSVQDLLWMKFPGVCPYCSQKPHREEMCKGTKDKGAGPDWEHLRSIGESSIRSRPCTLSDWEKMFGEIYPIKPEYKIDYRFARLSEEMGELAEALKFYRAAPQFFLNEAADLFAWLMNIRNFLKQEGSLGNLNEEFAAAYPGACPTCNDVMCKCLPIPTDIVVRTAQECPYTRDVFESLERSVSRFRPVF